MRNVIFLDRDGTLIREPHDFRVDDLAKLSFLPGVIGALRRLSDAGYDLVIVSNQDGLGKEYAWEKFNVPHQKMLEIFEGEGVRFWKVLIDTHYAAENHPNRKPNIGLVKPFLDEVDLARSWMVGDRKTDAVFAKNLGVRSLTIKDPLSHDGDVRITETLPEFHTVRYTSWNQIEAHIFGFG
jgi:imidazoleglycerol-phosphate dehydratase/histidinol-phosphatase